MTWQIGKIIISALLISFASWLSGKSPRAAGMVIALPLTSMIVLAMSYAEYRDPARTAEFARNILISIPLSLLFFVPFLFAEKLKWGFPALYASGVALLVLGYGASVMFSRAP